MRIKDWIKQGGSFLEGMQLLDQLGIKDSILEQAKHRPFITSSDKERLKQLLLPHIELESPSKPISTAEPASIQAIRRKAILQLKKRDALRAQLAVVPSDQERFEIAQELMEEVIPTIDRLYDQIHQFEETGEVVREDQQSIIQQTVQKMQRIQSLRPRISRLKNWLTKTDLPTNKKIEYQKELSEKEIELANLLSELNLD